MLNGLKLPNFFSIPVFYFSLFFIGFFLFVSILFFPYLPHNLRFVEGMTSPRTVFSPKTMDVETSVNRHQTQKLRRNSSGTVEQIYTIDQGLNREILSDLHSFFSVIRRSKSIDGDASESLFEDYQFLSKESRAQLLALDDRSLRTFEYFTVQYADTVLSAGLISTDRLSIVDLVESGVDIWHLPRALKETSFVILSHFLKSNLVLDSVKSKQFAKELGFILPSTTHIREGQPIVFKGERITKQHLEIFRALGLLGNQFKWVFLAGIGFVVFLLFLLLERFIFYFNPRIHSDTKYMFVIFTLMFFGLLTSLLIQNIGPLPFLIESKFLIPIPIIAMMISLTLRTNISMLAGTVMSVFIAIMFRMDLSVFLYLFFSNCVTLFAAYKKYSRKDLIASGYRVGVMNVVIVVCIGLLTEQTLPLWYLSNTLISLASGIISAMVSLAILPYFESIFNITTRQTLMDLANLNHPLLKQLMVSAPGTYQHCMMVANLAEAAAELTYADPVLCRVGAYFHDIGKIKRPHFFTENQMGGESPHSGLTPRMSKMIISSHVKDGLELAHKHRLPDSVKDIIAQHHGTTLVSFFFIQALHQLNDKDLTASKDEFRYPGPKPQFKEAGIVMLADSAEAATRSLEKPTFSKVENMVEKVFRDKIDDHQLDECPLSLREIELIKETFLKIFKGIYHTRLDYQDELNHILNQQKKDA